jgi:hypothetical protein
MLYADIKINYVCPDGIYGEVDVKNKVLDSDAHAVRFDWVITDHVTAAAGKLAFLVCAKMTDDDGLPQHWNSKRNNDLYISEGLEVTDELIDRNHNLILDTGRIRDYAITNTKIKDGAVTTTKIKDNAVTGDKIAVKTIYTKNLSNKCITSEQLLKKCVYGEHLDDNAVTSDKTGGDVCSLRHDIPSTINVTQGDSNVSNYIITYNGSSYLSLTYFNQFTTIADLEYVDNDYQEYKISIFHSMQCIDNTRTVIMPNDMYELKIIYIGKTVYQFFHAMKNNKRYYREYSVTYQTWSDLVEIQ